MVPLNETQIVCLARFRAKKGEENQLIANLRKLIPLTRAEGGCIRYELNHNVKDPTDITFVEKFYDQKTFEEHCNKKYIKDFFYNDEKLPDHVESFTVDLYREILS